MHKLILIGLLLILSNSAFGNNKKPIPEKHQLKIMTFNVLYGFNRKQSVAKGFTWISKQNTDVIAFQEFTGISNKKFNEEAEKWGHKYTHIYRRKKGMPLALSSRYPITQIQEIDTDVNRGMLIATISGIEFVVVHLTSQRISDREKEFKLAKTVIQPMLKAGKKVIVLGDFNALSPLDKEVMQPKQELLTSMRLKKSANLNKGEFNYSVMKNFLELGLVDVIHQFNQGSSTDIVTWPSTITKKIQAAKDKKRLQASMLQRIDYILMSKNLVKDVEQILVNHDPELENISDHYPVSVILN